VIRRAGRILSLACALGFTSTARAAPDCAIDATLRRMGRQLAHRMDPVCQVVLVRWYKDPINDQGETRLDQFQRLGDEQGARLRRDGHWNATEEEIAAISATMECATAEAFEKIFIRGWMKSCNRHHRMWDDGLVRLDELFQQLATESIQRGMSTLTRMRLEQSRRQLRDFPDALAPPRTSGAHHEQ
jgi:hypothetical protein